MDTKIKTVCALAALLMVSGLAVTSVNADTDNPLTRVAMAIEVFVEAQSTIINQNDIMISQLNILIELTEANQNIYVPTLTDRYDVLEPLGSGRCVVYDKLTKDTSQEICPEGYRNLTTDTIYSILNGELPKP